MTSNESDSDLTLVSDEEVPKTRENGEFKHCDQENLSEPAQPESNPDPEIEIRETQIEPKSSLYDSEDRLTTVSSLLAFAKSLAAEIKRDFGADSGNVAAVCAEGGDSGDNESIAARNDAVEEIDVIPVEKERRADLVLRELVQSEENYTKNLENGVNLFIRQFEVAELPIELQGQKFRLFSNIETIYKLHSERILPALKEAENIIEASRVFYDFIRKNFLYCYVIYAVCHPGGEKLAAENVEFFKKIQEKTGETLGVQSFLVQPIQRLPKYKLLFSELIDALGKCLEFSEEAKLEMAACCYAVKQIQKLLDQVNESMSINDIRNSFEINVLHQGMFRKMSKFRIYDKTTKKHFDGKVFAFDKSIIYAELTEETILEYRGFLVREDLVFIDTDDHSILKLISLSKEIELTGEANQIREWVILLGGKRKKDGQMEITLRKKKIFRKKEILSVRMPVFSHHPSLSRVSSREEDNRCSTGSTYGIYLPQWERTVNWVTLLNLERHFLLQLETHKKYYLDRLRSKQNDHNVESFLQIYSEIIDFHRQEVIPSFQQNIHDFVSITMTFRRFLNNKRFDLYKIFAIESRNIVDSLKALENDLSETLEMRNGTLQPIEDFLEIPLRHIQSYITALQYLFQQYTMGNPDPFFSISEYTVLVEELKQVEIAMKYNLHLHGLETLGVHFEDIGLIQYSDNVTTEFSLKPNHRVFLTENCLLLVNVKIEMKDETRSEVFTKLESNIKIKNLGIKKSNKNNKAIKLYRKTTMEKFKIFFDSEKKRKEFITNYNKLFK